MGIFFHIEKVENSFIFETFGKKTIKLICHTYMHEAISDIIEQTDHHDHNAQRILSSVLVSMSTLLNIMEMDA